MLKPRWNLIEETLLQTISNSHDLEKAIKSYNTRYQEIWDFVSLHELFVIHFSERETRLFFDIYLPKLVTLALQLPQLIQCPIPLLKQGKNGSISMSQQQAACLLANGFFCTFPRRNTDKSNSEYANYPDINFNKLYSKRGENVIEKLKCVVNYFRRVLDDMPKNIITFQRRSIDVQQDWENSTLKLSRTKFCIESKGRIEEGDGMLQVDFANRFIGGGVLGHGCVQEEIRFVINTEMIVARLFTECLNDQEALIMIGCEQFHTYNGYALSFEWGGDFFDQTPLDAYRRRKRRVVAIDALSYRNNYEQFIERNFRRDLKKAYVGFFSEDVNDRSPIASGLWGCGAFNGQPIRSVLIQFMACSLLQRNIVIYTFGDKSMKNKIIDICSFLKEKDVTVGQLYKLLRKYRIDGNPDDPDQLVPFIKKNYKSICTSNNNINNRKLMNVASSLFSERISDVSRTQSTDKKGASDSSSKRTSFFNLLIHQKNQPSTSRSNNEQDISHANPQPMSTSSNEDAPNKSSESSRDQQRFDDIAKSFDTKFKKQPENKGSSLLECLDSAMDEMSNKKSSMDFN